MSRSKSSAPETLRLPGQFQLETDMVPQGDQPQAIEGVVQRVSDGEKYVTLLGVTGSGKTFTMAHTVQRLQRPTLVISPNKTLAAQLVSEFRALFPNSAVEYFVSYFDYYQPEAYVPQIDLYIEKDSSVNEEIDRLRHRATQALLTRRDVIVVASVSCIYGLGSPEDYRASVVELRVGQTITRQALLEQLVHMKYQRNDVELKRGRFTVRGGTVDVMGAGETVHRIVLDGSTVSAIAEMDAVTREEKRELDQLSVFPATHFLTVDERMQEILPLIERERDARVKELLKAEKIVEAQRLKGRVDYDLEMLRETGYCTGVENYARYFAGRKPGEPPYTLLDFFPDDMLVFLDESHVTVPQMMGMHKGDRSRKDNLVEFGWRLPSCRDNRPLTFPEFLGRIPQAVFVSATPGPFERKVSKGVVEQIIRPTGLVDPPIEVRPLAGHIEDLVKELRLCVEAGDRALVTTLTKRTSEELSNYLTRLGLRVRYLHSEVETLKRVEVLRDLRIGEFDILVGINLLREGLDLPEVSFVAILDADKEGYLRSETSIVQTAGRASRNERGRVVLYADRVTGSMARAMGEMTRRRTVQLEYNRAHGIVPESVQKEVRSLLAPADELGSGSLSTSGLGKKWKERLPLLLANLEEEMRLAAERLDFEEAARIRDRIREVKREAKAPSTPRRPAAEA
ncbi:MAG: excinuclease ABC subunit UvrB [Thermoplasmata archaeon]|nr:excinuclease ABC subunit UvrB [Thermoplasmata archaeon]